MSSHNICFCGEIRNCQYFLFWLRKVSYTDQYGSLPKDAFMWHSSNGFPFSVSVGDTHVTATVSFVGFIPKSQRV